MQIPDSEFLERPWRIHEIASDFGVEDVWALPTPGGRADEFPYLVERFAASEPTGILWTIRWKLGELFGWDDDATSAGGRVESLRTRLPADLRSHPGPAFAAMPFESLYLLPDEWAAEVANQTMHGVMHMGWVPDGDGFRAQMTVLVKPNGLFGRAYMAAIRPFRHAIVYPVAMRQIEREWQARPARV